MQKPFTKAKKDGSNGWHNIVATNEKLATEPNPIEPKTQTSLTLKEVMLHKINQINNLLDEIENLKLYDDK